MTENTTQDTTTTADAAATVVEHVNPSTLLVDLNVRHTTRLDADLIESVRQHGVLVPIVAVRTPDGGVRVRHGHRRTHAAIEAALPTVPVVVVGQEGASTDDEIERLVGQHAENTHRTGLTQAEQIDVVAQLTLLGVSAHQIAKRTRIARSDVDAAKTIAASATIAAAADRNGEPDALDLDQLATLVEFEDNPDTVDRLVYAARSGRTAFQHAAQRARDDRDRERTLSEFTSNLISAGHTMADADTGTPLARLVDAEGHAVTGDNHTTCPGHAVRAETRHGYVDPTTGMPPVTTDDDTTDDVTEGDSQSDDLADEGEGDDDEDWDAERDADLVWGSYPEAVWVCTDPETNGHRDRWASNRASSGYGEPRRTIADMDPADAAAARVARRDVIESNKAWAAAEPVRQRWVRTLLARKTPPTNAAAFLAAALTTDRHVFSGHRVPEVTADLLGTTAPGYGQANPIAAMIDKASSKRCEVIALGLVLAAYEANLNGTHWRNVDPSTARYLRFLDEVGYDRSNVERRATGDDPLPEPNQDSPAADAGE
jgi:ParB family chromosome partitioning protein